MKLAEALLVRADIQKTVVRLGVCPKMSGFVRLEKDSKQPEWEVSSATYLLDGNILKYLCANILWKWPVGKKDKNRLNVVTPLKSRMGS
jgi:hypothetical protein